MNQQLRRLVLLLGLIVGLGWTACTLQVDPTPAADLEPWRRTTAGWQNVSAWDERAEKFDPSLHPALFATLEVLLSLAALVAFSPDENPWPATARRR